jgi:hypothetical protein
MTNTPNPTNPLPHFKIWGFFSRRKPTKIPKTNQDNVVLPLAKPDMGSEGSALLALRLAVGGRMLL